MIKKDYDWLKGEMAFDHGGQSLTMKFTFRALSKVPGIMDGKPRGTTPATVRRLLTLGLSHYHPDMTEAEVGAMIEAIGPDDARKLVRDALQASEGHPWPALVKRGFQPA